MVIRRRRGERNGGRQAKVESEEREGKGEKGDESVPWTEGY